MNDLMIAERKDLAAVFGCGGIDSLLEEIEVKARSFVADASTAKGRKEIASMAFAIARTKTALDEAGKNLVAERKKIIGMVDAERKMVRDRLDALRDEVRRPLDEWEQAEKDRVSALEARMAEIVRPPCGTSAHAAERIAWLESVEINESWQERAADAAKAKDAAIREWKAYRIVTAASEQAAAEAEDRAKAEAERAQREREERIAREAAERATREAEQRAAKEKAEAERRAIEAEQRAAKEKAEAERRAIEAEQRAAKEKAEAERRAIEAEQRAAKEKAEAERRAIEAEQRAAKEKAEAERRAIEAEQRAKQAEADAERKAQEAVAREAAERRRIVEEEEAARKRREDDEKHKLKIMESACKALLAIGLSQESALSVVLAIADGKVPHINISY